MNPSLLFPHKTRLLRFIGAAATVSLLVAFAIPRVSSAPALSQSAERQLQDGWTLVQQSGAYSFVTRVTQTTLPAPTRANVGRLADVKNLIAQGQLDNRAQTMNLQLWDNEATAFDTKHALELAIDKDGARGRTPGGDWTALENPGDVFAPGGDAAAYLKAARHVSDLGKETRTLPGNGATLTSQRLQFAIDGAGLAAHLKQQLEADMRARGKLAPGMSLDMAAGLKNAVGHGDTWLDAEGFPLRTRFELEFPENAAGERVLMQVQTDFTGFDRSGLFLRGTIFGRQIQTAIYNLIQGFGMPQLVQLLSMLYIVALALLLRLNLPRRVRQAMMAGLAVVLMSPDLAQPHPAQAAQRPAPAAAAPAMSVAGAPAAAAAISVVKAASAVDAATEPDADRDGLSDDLEVVWTTGVNTTDTDGDGLTDGDEVRRCVDRNAGLSANQLTGKNLTWPSCSNPRTPDTDGDGLIDNQEVVYLGTSPNLADTDGDGLSDLIETRDIQGSNPLNPDTDGDGLLDGVECPSLTCRNSGGSATPDIFEFDNDADGFIGSFDLSPNTVVGNFDAANPFQLAMTRLNPNKQVFVDFQIRPVDANHIGYIQSVLDWPSGDTDGQIQRRIDSTFADVTTLPAGVRRPGNDPQSYGDVRLVPMLEIEMDGSATVPLPRTTAVQTYTLQSAPQIAAVQLLSETADITVLGIQVSTLQDMRVRITQLSTDYSGYSMRIDKGSCEGARTFVWQSTGNLNPNDERTVPGQAMAQIADGGHVATLSATGLLTPLCTPIGRVVPNADGVPFGFALPVQQHGTLVLHQAGANVSAALALTGRSGAYDVTIHPGTCQDSTTALASLSVPANGSATANNTRLVDWANGGHVARVKQATRPAICTPLGNIVNGASGNADMIDAQALGRMGISVSELDASGKLVAQVPLFLAQDPRTGVTSGFAGTMLYRNGATLDWEHRVRMSWWVQMLTDNCSSPPADYLPAATEKQRLTSWCGANGNRMQLVHVYDEQWKLAGLTVREEHNFDMNVIFEDPATDNDLNSEDYLWHLAKGLDEQFVTGVDCVRANAGSGCVSDNARDLTLTGIYSTFHRAVNGSIPITQQWGIPSNTLHVEKLDTQLSSSLDLADVAQTHVPRLLNTHFLSGTVSRAIAPMMLFVSENSFRNIAMGEAGYATTASGKLTVDFDPPSADARPLITLAGINMAPYRFVGAIQGWEGHPFQDYWDVLALRLKDSPRINAGSDDDGKTITEAKVRLAQTYFAYLYAGRANLAETDGIPMGRWDVNAALYASQAERKDSVIKALDLGGRISQGSIINEVIEPLAEAYFENIDLHRFQRTLLQDDATANLLQRVTQITGDPDNSTLAKTWRNILGDTRDSLKDSFIEGFKPGSNATRLGRWTLRASAGVAGAAVIAGVVGVILAAQRGNGLRAAQHAINGATLAVEIVGSVNMATSAAKAAAEATSAGLKAGKAMLDSLTETTKAAGKASVVTAVITQLINVGVFVMQAAVNRMMPGSLEFNALAAGVVSGTIVAGLFIALSSTGVGAIITAIIGLIDSLVALICGFLSDEQSESLAGELLCKGISGWLTELVSIAVYAQNDITRVSDPRRLTFLKFQPGLADAAGGFRPDAQLTLAMTMRNTLRLAPLPVNIGILYGWQFSDSQLQTARFAYDVIAAEPAEGNPELHDQLSRGSGPNPWTPILESGKLVRVYSDAQVNSNGVFRLPAQAGLNQKVSAFLAEGYAVPMQECAAVYIPPAPAPVVGCDVRERKHTNYNDLNLTFDVFPATLDAFYTLESAGGNKWRQNWARNEKLNFPALTDADGDGLAFDADPDDTRWDADGDGLSDALEVSRGSSPASPDADGDGLTDVQELLRGSDPRRADSDGDGVNDGDELQGWTFAYGFASNGTPLIGKVSSDPLNADLDRDGISDAQEKVYGLNPHVRNNFDALSYEARLSEADAPPLLLRFDEGANIDTFADTAGDGVRQNGFCFVDTCPVSGLRGRFGNAASFNGTNQYLKVVNNPLVQQLNSTMRIEAWINPNAVIQARSTIVQLGMEGPGQPGVVFGLLGGSPYYRISSFGVITEVFQSTQIAIPLNTWTHVALAFGASAKPAIFINGVRNTSYIVQDVVNYTWSSRQIVIGAEQKPVSDTPPGPDGVAVTQQINHFSGLIDEVVIEGLPNSAAQIDPAPVQKTMDARYNPSDGLLGPGQKVQYRAELENELMARALNGTRTVNFPPGLTTQPGSTTQLVLPPAGRLSFQNDFSVRSDAASGLYTISQSVDGIVNTPSIDEWRDPGSTKIFGWIGPQVFNGTRFTSIEGRQDINLNGQSFTYAGWVRPTSNDSQRRGIIGRGSGRTDAAPYLLHVGQQLRFGFGRGGSVAEAGANDGDANVLTLNEWNFVAVSFDASTNQATFFINGVQRNTAGMGGSVNVPFNRSLWIGRASNQASLSMSRFTLQCEGDGSGDGEYSLIASNSSVPLWTGSGSDGATWSLGLNNTFVDNLSLTVCEDDNGTYACEGSDENMGALVVSTDMAPFTNLVSTFTGIPNNYACSYDWGAVGFPDIGTLTTTLTNDSLPFAGELRGIEIHNAALNLTQINNLRARNELVAHYGLDDLAATTTFKDDTGFHPLTCAPPQCPVAVGEGRHLGAFRFDGVDDVLTEGVTPLVATDYASNNTGGFAMSFWVKPENPNLPFANNTEYSLLSFGTPGGSKYADVMLVHRNNDAGRWTLRYRDHVNNSTIQINETLGCGTQFPALGMFYDSWAHVILSVDSATNQPKFHINFRECAITNNPSSSYRPAANQQFSVGRSLYAGTTPLPYRGMLDQVRIYRKALLGFFSEIQADYDLAPESRVRFDPDALIGASLVNTPPAGATLVKGVRGNAMRFDMSVSGDAFSPKIYEIGRNLTYTVDYGDALGDNTSTIAVWVKAEQRNLGWAAILGSPNRPSNFIHPGQPDFALGIYDGYPMVAYRKNVVLDANLTVAAATQRVIPNTWQHIVVRRDGTNLALFVNGYKASGALTGWENASVYAPALLVGKNALNERFHGSIDEVTFFRAALSDRQIREMYNYQSGWLDESVVTPVRVDTDVPTVTLQLPNPYLANVPQTVLVLAADASSKVSMVELGATRLGLSQTWSGARPDVSDLTGNAWAPLFTPSGDGVYLLDARAIDGVGNRGSLDAQKFVYVDARAPIVTVSSTLALSRPQPAFNEPAVWQLALSGTARDRVINSTSIPGSGVKSVSVRVSSGNGDAATLYASQPATLDLATGLWSIRYKLNLANPTGEFTATVVAVDAMGNQGTAAPVRIRMDTTAPQAFVQTVSSQQLQRLQRGAANPGYPNVLTTDSVIGGEVSEQPRDVPAQPEVAGVSGVDVALNPIMAHAATLRNRPLPATVLLYVPLDESARTPGADTQFVDVSPARRGVLRCAGSSCPTTGAQGRSAQAVTFDGIDDALTLTHTAAINSLVNNFTLAAWIRPDGVTLTQRIIGPAFTNSTDGYSLAISGGYVVLNGFGGDSYVSSNPLIVPGVWQHLAVHVAPNRDLAIYINGQLIEQIPGGAPFAPDTADVLMIGARSGFGNATTAQHFKGAIDELAILSGAPTAADWEWLLGAQPMLHLTFDQPFINPGRLMPNDAGLQALRIGYYEFPEQSQTNVSTAGKVGTGALKMTHPGELTAKGAPGQLPLGNGAYTVAFWAALADVNGVVNVVVYDDSGLENQIRLLPGLLSTYWFNGQVPELIANVTTAPGTWRHVTLSWDGSRRTLYLDGTAVASDVTDANTFSNVEPGMNAGGNGTLDDLRVYRHALNAAEVKALAQAGWRAATLGPAQSASSLARSAGTAAQTGDAENSWLANVPAGLEGFYELQSRGSDALGNVGTKSGEYVTWRGTVDSLAPRILEYTAVTGTSSIAYRITVEDFNLMPTAAQMPLGCAAGNTTITRTPYQSPWYLAMQSQMTDTAVLQDRTYQLTLECTTPILQQQVGFILCDAADNCVRTGATLQPTATPTATAPATATPTPTATPTGTPAKRRVMLPITTRGG